MRLNGFSPGGLLNGRLFRREPSRINNGILVVLLQSQFVLVRNTRIKTVLKSLFTYFQYSFAQIAFDFPRNETRFVIERFERAN